MGSGFFDLLLPQEGYLCAARLCPSGGFHHQFFEDTSRLEQYLLHMDAKGETMYLAQAAFATDQNRKSVNVHAVRSFWLDIDCGEAKYEKTPHLAYPTQVDACKDVRRAVEELHLPFPTMVNSGNGLYAHWFLTSDIPEQVWKAAALVLKNVLQAIEFKADPQRTADSASVLRPPGTTNRKNGNAKPVHVVGGRLTDPVDYREFLGLLEGHARRKKIAVKGIAPPKPSEDVNSILLEGLQTVVSAHTIAERCQQLKDFRASGGDVSEPLWYAVIGVLRHTVEKDQVIHEWSSGYSGYTYEETQRKIDQHNFPPTSCAHIGGINPDGCIGCRHKDKGRSPLSFGYEIKEEAPPVEVESLGELVMVEPPSGFKRTPEGLFFAEEGEAPLRFYLNDLFPISLAKDRSLGYETVTFKHRLPQEGWQEFTVKSSITQDPRSCLSTLHDNHVQTIGTKNKGLLVQYCDGYISKLRQATRLRQLHTQMGWCEDEASPDKYFVLGSRMYTRTGVEAVGLAQNIPAVAKEFTEAGNIAPWVRMTSLFDAPGTEPLAFALLAGAFGAPLLKFTGHSGALLALTGPSGVGKTLIGRMIMSVYGNPDRLILLRDDTRNMLITRLGLYGTLPVYIDEITNIDPLDLSDLVYRITQGRDKGRLSKNAVEKAVLNFWNTIAVTSSNASLVAKLAHAKMDASAEINRVLEYAVPPMQCLTRDTGKSIFDTVSTNYGGVGDRYVRWLVKNQDTHKQQIEDITTKIIPADAKADERFWYAIAGCALYGGAAAKSLGIISFDLKPIVKWTKDLLVRTRDSKIDHISDPIDALGYLITELMPNCLIVDDSSKRFAKIISEPRGATLMRLEKDRQRLFIMRDVIRKKLSEKGGEMGQVGRQLASQGILLHNNHKNLGIGTYLSSMQVKTWEIDLKHPALGHMVMQAVENTHGEAAAKAVAI